MAAILKTALGDFRGKKGDGVTQFLGIKYASVQDQLAAPEPFAEYGEGVVDASRYGYVLIFITILFLFSLLHGTARDMLIHNQTPRTSNGRLCIRANDTDTMRHWAS